MQFTGERQVAETVDGIRRDHTARYEWAAKRIPEKSNIIDVACGVGYGTNILAKAGHAAVGIDISGEAIAYARKHYGHIRNRFQHGDASNLENIGEFDVGVSFETIEHVEDPRPLLRTLHRAAPRLLASVPNEDEFPYIGYDFHFRHYTKSEFESLLNETGWQVEEWFGQEGNESEVEPGAKGRTIIAYCERMKEPKRVEIPSTYDHKIYDPRTGRGVPEHVVIVGLGPSAEQYVDLTKRLGGRHKYCDEVWVINALGNVLQADRVFHMDDVRIQEIRAKAEPDSNIAAMLPWLKSHPGPVYTSRPHPDYPGLVAFPLEDVLNDLGYDYFNSTAAYAVALAIHIGVKKISIYGCDYTYPNAHDAEKGRGCVEYWLGYAAKCGIKISLPTKTTLLDAIHARQDRLYGYDTVNVELKPIGGGKVAVSFTERDNLPTAKEIEDSYDHSKHPSALVAKK